MMRRLLTFSMSGLWLVCCDKMTQKFNQLTQKFNDKSTDYGQIPFRGMHRSLVLRIQQYRHGNTFTQKI